MIWLAASFGRDMNQTEIANRPVAHQTAVYRTMWLLITAGVIWLILLAIPHRFAMLQEDIYGFGEGLEALGLSLTFFATYFVVWELVVVFGAIGVGLLIMWYRSDEWFATLVAITLTLFGLLPPLVEGLSFVNEAWRIPVALIRFGVMGCLMAVFCLFPNGRFAPKWSRWLLIAWLLFSVFMIIVKPDVLADTAVLPNSKTVQDALWLLIGVGWFSIAIVGQVGRYRRFATPTEQQQMKMVLFGNVTVVAFSLIGALLLIQIPSINAIAANRARFTLIMGALYLLAGLAVPISIALSILRFRLWQIDIIINRSLVYGGLTVLVTAVYILLVGSVSTLASSQNGRWGALALTLVVMAVVARPLHRWLDDKVHQLLLIKKPQYPTKIDSQPALVRWLRAGWIINLLLVMTLFIVGLIIQVKTGTFKNPTDMPQFSDIAIARVLVNNVLIANANLDSIFLIASYGQAIAFAGLGLFIFRKKSKDVMGVVASWMFLSIGLGFTPTIVGLPVLAPAWHIPVTLFQIGLFGSILLFLSLFPNGRIYPNWAKYGLIGWLIFMLLWLPFPQLNLHRSTAIWPAFFFALIVFLGMIIQLFRYRSISDAKQKQQMRWVLFGFLFANMGLLSIGVLTELNLMLATLPQLLSFIFLALGPLFIPLTITIALLRYRLWQIDIIINRTLVYGGLTAVILLTYALLVGGLSLLWRSQNNLLISLLATGLIAVLFQPVRERLQRAANRLMFGERDDPYGVLSKLGRRLQETAVPGQTLPAITATICQSLKLPYAAIIIQRAAGGRQTVAASGQWTPILQEWPLLYQNETIGWLVAAPRAANESFTAKEQQLLADIAVQAGPVAHSVRLTTALQTAREKLVLTREEERRRIRRDLHDELGPSLASQTFKLDAALDLLESDPQAVAELLKTLKAQNQSLVGDIRQLVYALRPPALDELGLAGALQAHVEQVNGRHTQISLDMQPEQLRFLSAAVEVAAYRIALEGINNVLRHANAQSCVVSIERSNAQLTLKVWDDGQGLPPQANGGVGFSSMRERVEELGGQLRIQANQPTGTVITAVFPTGGPYEQIVPATPKDLPLVMGIISEAAAWLKEKGIDQWPSPPNQHWWRRTAAFIEKGEMHIAYQDGTAIGVLRLNLADAYWPDDGLAGYVHGLAIRNQVHGRGVGHALLAWAEVEIRRQKRPFLRLDCAAGNGRLRQYYEDQGFIYRRQVSDHDYVAALYELEVT